jgi:hypothetical protein
MGVHIFRHGTFTRHPTGRFTFPPVKLADISVFFRALAPRRGKRKVSKISDLRKSGKANRLRVFRGVPCNSFPPFQLPGLSKDESPGTATLEAKWPRHVTRDNSFIGGMPGRVRSERRPQSPWNRVSNITWNQEGSAWSSTTDGFGIVRLSLDT